MSNKSIKPVVLAAGALMLGSMALASSAFAMSPLAQGYQVAGAEAKAEEGKCGEGKCGAKGEEGKCGSDKAGCDACSRWGTYTWMSQGPPTEQCQPNWGDCTHSACCPGLVCAKQSEWYSQCTPQ